MTESLWISGRDEPVFLPPVASGLSLLYRKENVEGGHVNDCGCDCVYVQHIEGEGNGAHLCQPVCGYMSAGWSLFPGWNNKLDSAYFFWRSLRLYYKKHRLCLSFLHIVQD